VVALVILMRKRPQKNLNLLFKYPSQKRRVDQDEDINNLVILLYRTSRSIPKQPSIIQNFIKRLFCIAAQKNPTNREGGYFPLYTQVGELSNITCNE